MFFKYLTRVLLALLAFPSVVCANGRMNAAIQAVNALAANTEQLQRYCGTLPDGPNIDAVQAEAMSVELDKFWASLGPDYEALGGLEGELIDNSKEVAALEAAFDELEKKCKRD